MMNLVYNRVMAVEERKFLDRPLGEEIHPRQSGSPTVAEVLAIAYATLGQSIPRRVEAELEEQAMDGESKAAVKDVVTTHNQLIELAQKRGVGVEAVGELTVLTLTGVITGAPYILWREAGEIKRLSLAQAILPAAAELMKKLT